jgi:hypothetical protein
MTPMLPNKKSVAIGKTPKATLAPLLFRYQMTPNPVSDESILAINTDVPDRSILKTV